MQSEKARYSPQIGGVMVSHHYMVSPHMVSLHRFVVNTLLFHFAFIWARNSLIFAFIWARNSLFHFAFIWARNKGLNLKIYKNSIQEPQNLRRRTVCGSRAAFAHRWITPLILSNSFIKSQLWGLLPIESAYIYIVLSTLMQCAAVLKVLKVLRGGSRLFARPRWEHRSYALAPVFEHVTLVL